MIIVSNSQGSYNFFISKFIKNICTMCYGTICITVNDLHDPEGKQSDLSVKFLKADIPK